MYHMTFIFQHKVFRKWLIKCFLSLLLPAVAVNSKAQEAFVSNAANAIHPNLLFKGFTTKDGLPEDRVRTLFQDSKGYLWIGTMNGLSRYDGYVFKNYYPARDQSGIAGNWVYTFAEDRKGNIWMGTREGLSKFDGVKEIFTNFKVTNNRSSSLISNLINTLHFDEHGSLWIGTAKGLSIYDEGKKQFTHKKSYPFDGNVSRIIAAANGHLWIATKYGICLYDISTGRYQLFKLNLFANPYGDRLWTMMEYKKDLYIATAAQGLLKLEFDSSQNTYTRFIPVNFNGGSENLSDTQVFDICVSGTDDFWLATEKGLYKVGNMADAEQRTAIVYRHNPLVSRSLFNNIIYKVIIDRTNVLWCGTESGLNKLDLHLLPFQYFSFTDRKYKDQVRGISFVKPGQVWLGTSNSGLYSYNISNKSSAKIIYKAGSSFNFNRSLQAGNDGRILSGSLGGLTMFPSGDPSKQQIYLKNRAVFDVLKDRKGNTWLGTNKGMVKINRYGKETNLETIESLPGLVKNGFIRELFEDHNGWIWIGFENSGLGVLHPETYQFIWLSRQNSGAKIFGNTIVSIAEAPIGTIWAGSESALNRIVTGSSNNKQTFKIKSYAEESGLNDKTVNGIIPDDKGTLWISTMKGLQRFYIKSETFVNYLSDISFSPGSYDNFGFHHLVFGTNDGFLYFDPAAVGIDDHAPKIVINDFKLFSQSVKPAEVYHGDTVLKDPVTSAKEIELNYLNNVFTLSFSAIHFTNPEKTKYAYRMDGFDKNWRYTDAGNRNATYTNLNAGTYTFYVKAANSAGKWSDEEAKIQIKILPPPWKTWWAIVLYVLLFNILLFIIIRYFLEQSRQKQLLKYEKLEKAQLGKLNEMKLQFFTDVSHEFRTPLSLIIGPVEELMQIPELPSSYKSKVNLVYRNCRKLLYLVEELMTFQKMEQGMLKLKPLTLEVNTFCEEIFKNFETFAQKKNIDFTFEKSGNELLVNADPAKLEMVLNNLIFNAFKFTPDGGKIAVKVDDAKTTFAGVTVTDNGKGMSPEELNHVFERYFSESGSKGTGVGLSLTKSLVEMHHGFIDVTSEPAISTSFSFYLPLIVSDHQLKVSETQSYQLNAAEDIATLSESFYIQNHPVALDEPATGTEKRMVLLVDDNPEILEYLVMIFRDDYVLKTAGNGEEALLIIAENTPDLVISDVVMPIMDGVALCHNIKSDIHTSHIPLILLSAKGAVENQIAGLETGADDYIPKPFHPGLLKTKAFQLMEARQRMMDKIKTEGYIVPKDIAKNPLDEAFLAKIMKGIEDNIANEDFSVEDLGALVFMSRSHLFRKLKSLTGQTPIEMIYKTRMKHAMKLLMERKHNISEISYLVGFKNHSSFTSSFKKQFGKSPTDFLADVIHKGR
jgi:signal transduction histidine kinase/ligand-binding sensor domain-containing protein/AraC-like DNA-binding protein/ActR/RegA family two-component response regulator